MLFLAAALLAAVQPLPAHESVTFGREPSFEPEAVQVRVGWLPRDRDQSQGHWYERRGQRHNRNTTYAWTTTQACPPAAAVLDRLSQIEMPSFANPRTDGMILATFDGAGYTLETMAYYGSEGRMGDVSLRSNVGTSLAAWVDEMLAALQPCWSSERPETGEQPLTSH